MVNGKNLAQHGHAQSCSSGQGGCERLLLHNVLGHKAKDTKVGCQQ